MDDQQPAAVGGLVDRLAADLDPAEIEAVERLAHLVMVAGDIDDARATLRALENPPDDVIMLGRPEMPLLEPPAVDDVADEVKRLAIDMVEEIDQHCGVAAARAQVNVADPHRTIAPPLADQPFGNMRIGGEGIGKAGGDGQGRNRCHVTLRKQPWAAHGLDRRFVTLCDSKPRRFDDGLKAVW